MRKHGKPHESRRPTGMEQGQQLVALAELGQHGSMSRAAEDAVVNALKSQHSIVRQTALRAIERQPGNFREHLIAVASSASAG